MIIFIDTNVLLDVLIIYSGRVLWHYYGLIMGRLV